jgi:enamine deaminase RidA (YjgF/YER057c/UK114 family)
MPEKNVSAILNAAGTSLERVVSVTVILLRKQTSPE